MSKCAAAAVMFVGSAAARSSNVQSSARAKAITVSKFGLVVIPAHIFFTVLIGTFDFSDKASIVKCFCLRIRFILSSATYITSRRC